MSGNVTGDGEICATSMDLLPYCFAWRPTITRPGRRDKDESAGRPADESQHLRASVRSATRLRRSWKRCDEPPIGEVHATGVDTTGRNEETARGEPSLM